MRVLVVIAALVVLALAGLVQAAGRMDTTCPAVDLTGRRVVRVIVAAGEVRCVYKRPADAAECPHSAPTGWTLVGVIDAKKHKEKVSCVYHDLSGD